MALNWLEFDETTERFDWHDLLRAFVRSSAAVETRHVASLQHAWYFTGIAQQAMTLIETGHQLEGLAKFDTARPHIEAAFANCVALGDDQAIVALVDWVGGDLALFRFHPRQRIVWLTAHVEAAKAVGYKASEGTALGNLGLAYADLGEPRKAIAFYDRDLVIAREIGDRRGEAFGS